MRMITSSVCAIIVGVVVLGVVVLGGSGCGEAEPAFVPGDRPGARPGHAEAEPREAPPARPAATAAPANPLRVPPAPTPPAAQPAPDDVAAPPANAERSASGLAWRVLAPGRGTAHPGPTDHVRAHYTGWRSENGEMFDSSRRRGQALMFRLNQVIGGWTEGLQLMVEGETRRFWIPANLAYEGRPTGPQGMLVFDVELVAIVVPPETPDNVAAPPAGAERTESGIASIVLQAGTGTRHPTATDRVEVHYTGWRAEDGERFDSSVLRGQPFTRALNSVIAGWTEGVQLMVEGEKRRFWIPANLAYEGNPRGPQGTLVFDIELLRIL